MLYLYNSYKIVFTIIYDSIKHNTVPKNHICI